MSKNPQVSRTVLSFVSNLILAVLIIAGVVTGFSLLPVNGNYKILSILSGSMEPGISTGSLVLIKKSLTYEVGDVITFLTADKKQYITHRICTKEENIDGKTIYKTKGDANEDADPNLVLQSEIVGKDFLTIPFLGYLAEFVKTLPGLIVVILIPALIIIFEEIFKIRRELKIIIKNRETNKMAGEASERKKNVQKNN